jgi:hypothetical protein
MLDSGQYLLAVAAPLLLLAAMALVALRLRELLLPGWRGSRARLAESVIAIGALSTIALVLGSFGLLNAAALLVTTLLAAGVAEWGARRLRLAPMPATSEEVHGAPEPAAGEPQPAWSRLAAVAVAALVTAHWGIAVSWSIDAGITNFDSVWYHLPFAAEIAQSGSTLELIRTDTVFVNWLYPQGAELLHAIGMILTGRDLLSLALNLGWLGLALLAAWCIGRPYGRGHLTVVAAAVLLECHNLIARTPGTAKNDIMAIALLLAAVALIVNLAAASAASRGGDRRLEPGWPLALAALAVGLAAGTKVTALAPAAGLTVAAIALCRPGLRLRGTAWWATGLVVGGAYWYLRNLVVAGNPLPQLRHLGPLNLPGPDRLQTGRPDFTVSHYLFDTEVWREYFFPGLERGFGPLWPLVVAMALAGALFALWRLLGRLKGDQVLGWLGLAALIGMIAYLFTPLSAAGPEGSPTAFAINLRFAIPAMMLGLVLLPLVPRLSSARAGWALFAALALLALATNRVDAVLTDSGRLVGWSLALGLVVLPALGIWLLSRTDRPALLGAAVALYICALVALGFLLQRSYFENRYAEFEPELGLADVYRWASDRQETRIGLAGTTAGFHGFGFYGADLSNEVVYLGRPAPRGGFDAITECAEFRRAVNEAELDYLVTSPFLNFADIEAPIASPEARWIGKDPAAVAEIESGPVTLWRLEGPLEGGCGPAERPLHELPDSPLG